MRRSVLALLMLAALLSPLSPMSPASSVIPRVDAAAPPDSGPVLYQPSDSQFEELQYNLFANLLSTDGTHLQLPQKSSRLSDGGYSPSPYVVGKFSPDGASVVTPTCVAETACDADAEWTLEITSATSDAPVQIGRFADYPTDLAWSPDGSAIAALLRNPSSEPVGNATYRIVRVSVADGAVTTVLNGSTDSATNSTFEVHGSGLSWGPNGSIAFIGSKTVNGSYGFHDIYTVPAAGGTASRYNGAFPDDDVFHSFGDGAYCDGALSVEYHQPAWSPDGSSIAARMLLNDGRATCDDEGNQTSACDSRNQLVEVQAGAPTPSVLKDLPVELYEQDPENPSSCLRGYVSFKEWEPEPVWNLDGVHLLYGYAPADSVWAGDGVSTRIVDTDTLAETTPVTMSDKLPDLEEPERRYVGYYKDWQPCPTGTCVEWDEPETGADVRVRIGGYGDAGKVGVAEPVTITVTNVGPEAATDVSFRVRTPASTKQGWVQFRGAHAGWTCDASRPADLRCQGPGLADDRSVTLELGVVGAKVTRRAAMTATATSSSVAPAAADPNLANNQATSAQRITKLTRPAPPRKAGRGVVERAARGKWGWYRMDAGKNLWIYAENIVYKDPDLVEGLPGYFGATLWAYGNFKKVYRVNFSNSVCSPGAGICSGFLGHTSSGGDCYFGKQPYCYMTTGARVDDRSDKVQRSSWKFFPGKVVRGVVIRTGKAKKYTYVLPR